MQYGNKTTRDVADVVARILSGQSVSEELKGDQHKIDANKNNKIDAEDFKLLRAKKKKVDEEVELDESHFKVGDKVKCKSSGMKGEVVKLDKEHAADDEKYYTVKRDDGTMKKMAPEDMTKMNEDVDQLDEYEAKQGVYKHKSTYGSAKGAEFGATDYKKENEMAKAADKEKKKPARTAYGARQNFVRSYAKESFSNLIDLYRDCGLKSLQEALVTEEPTNDEFTKEVERQKRKASGTAPDSEKAKVAKAAVQAVKVEEDYEVLDEISAKLSGDVRMKRQAQFSADDTPKTREKRNKSAMSHMKRVMGAHSQADINKGFADDADKNRKRGFSNESTEIEERSLTEPEMNKKEDIVKGMKKGVDGFKDRYGDRAKSVMYATATKMAKKD